MRFDGKSIELNGWFVTKHIEPSAQGGDWYSVQHNHETDSIHEGQLWWTTGQWSTFGWRCAHCSEPVPAEIQGFIKLLEWNR